MTQPDEFIPEGAANYDSFAGFAATTQQEWEDQINDQWVTTMGPLSGICALFGQLPFLDGLAAYGGYPGNGNLVEGALNGIQLMADGLCGLATGNTGLTGSTPTTVINGVTTVTDAAANNNLFTEILGLGGDSGNMIVDLLTGVTSLVDSLLGLLGGDPFDTVDNLIDLLTGFLGGIPIIGDIVTLIGNAISDLLSGGLSIGDGSVIDMLISGDWFVDLLSLLGNPTDMGSGNPVLDLIDNIPILGPIVSSLIDLLVPGSAETGSTGLGDIFDDLLDLLGNPLGLGGGDASTLIPHENLFGMFGPSTLGEALQGIVDSLFQGFTGGSGTGNGLSTLSGSARDMADQVSWMVLNWPTGGDFPPEITYFSASGTYNIPADCTFLDVMVVGGGGGGHGCGLLWGEGGDNGAWNYATLERDVDIPLTTTTLSVTVGGGGDGNSGDGDNGTASSASGTGWAGISGAGGAGGNDANANIAGQSPGNLTVNGVVYYGGAAQHAYFGANGNAPGGGGAGGTITFMAGGDGAHGGVWVRAY